MATYTHTRYYSPTRYASEPRDSRRIVAVLAIGLLILSLFALAYMIRMTYVGYEHGGTTSDTLAANPKIQAQSHMFNKPAFINKSLFH